MAEAARDPVKYAVVFRLYPNDEQAAELRRWIGTCRALWNHLLDCQKLSLDLHEGVVSLTEMEQERQRWENEQNCEWSKDPQGQARQRIVKELGRAISDFFKSKKGKRKGARLGFPKFKAKRPGGTVYIANARLKVAEDGTSVDLGKIGTMRLRGGRSGIKLQNYEPDKRKRAEREPGHRIHSARIRLAANRWFLAVQVVSDAPPRTYSKPSRPALGVDVGLDYAVACGDGRKIEAPRLIRKQKKRKESDPEINPRFKHVEKLAKRRRRLARRLSASQKGSNRARRKSRALSRLEMRIADFRRDFQHVVSTRIVGKAETICLETLNVKAMARSRQAKGVADVGMAEIHRQIKYKAAWAGRKVAKLGQFDRSTGVCPDCGTVGPKLSLGIKRWTCAECGEVHDRDIAAARVIERASVETVGRVTAEPAPSPEPTRGESGVQAQPASPVASVPVVEPRTVGRVASEPAPSPEQTCGEMGVQAQPVRPVASVPVVEPRSESIGGLARRIPARTREPHSGRLHRGEGSTPSLGPLFDWCQYDSG